MNKVRNHTLSVTSAHMRRKHRSNILSKVHKPGYRAIATKSNTSNTLTVVDLSGNVVVQKTDKLLAWKKTERAFELGKIVASELQWKNINTLVFDRNGFRYIWRVKALCDGLREGGIIV